MKNLALILTLASGALLGIAPSAQALSISLTATGTITGVASPFAAGDPFSLTIQYNNAAGDVFPGDPTYGLFPAITALSFTSGAYAATAQGGNVLVNDANDYVLFMTTVTEGLTGGAIGGSPLKMFTIIFGGLPVTSDTLTSLTTDLLMQMPDRVVTLRGCQFFSGDAFGSGCGVGVAEALGTISSVSIVESSAVPEPGSMLLFGTGASVLAMRRRRRQNAA